MPEFAEPLSRLIQECKRLPGIGQKSAQRIAFHLLRSPREDAAQLAQAILDIKDKLGICEQCNNISDGDLCLYCRDPNREHSQICVIEEPHNILPIESTHYRGLYHVLHGTISPLRGIGPEQLRIKTLIDRLHQTQVDEIILATNPTVEGEATAVYLADLLRSATVRVTRIATGVPAGSDIEYADEVTMTRAMEGRRELKF
jgi:recombination protein RecR